MGQYVIMTCDEAIDGSWPDDVLTAICDANAGREAMGRTVTEARQEAKSQGWSRIRGRDVCPGCQRAKREGIKPFRPEDCHD